MSSSNSRVSQTISSALLSIGSLCVPLSRVFSHSLVQNIPNLRYDYGLYWLTIQADEIPRVVGGCYPALHLQNIAAF